MKGSAVFIAGRQARGTGTNAQKTELCDDFQGRDFKGKVREGSCKVHVQLVYNSLIGWWLGNRVVSQGFT